MAELPPFVPAITYDGDVSEFRKFGPYLAPNEFEGWRQEVRSWKDGAYLGSTLCLSPTYRVTGPIRATVARFPYLTGERNEAIDVSALPR
jgi:hypothetical protein